MNATERQRQVGINLPSYFDGFQSVETQSMVAYRKNREPVHNSPFVRLDRTNPLFSAIIRTLLDNSLRLRLPRLNQGSVAKKGTRFPNEPNSWMIRLLPNEPMDEIAFERARSRFTNEPIPRWSRLLGVLQTNQLGRQIDQDRFERPGFVLPNEPKPHERLIGFYQTNPIQTVFLRVRLQSNPFPACSLPA